MEGLETAFGQIGFEGHTFRSATPTLLHPEPWCTFLVPLLSDISSALEV